MKTKKKMLLVCTVIPISIIVFSVFAPRFLLMKDRISHELSQPMDGVWLETSLESVRIIDYRGRWFSMYAKLELPAVEYEKLKQKFLQIGATAYSKDFSEDILGEASKYHYDLNFFQSEMSRMRNVKQRYGAQSLNLDDYDELIIANRLHGKTVFFAGTLGATTAQVDYVLAKENNGVCYLYICT